jgi:flavin reductase (DIM6/NTAB) family NADH-FMN oxidoreductase RutF
VIAASEHKSNAAKATPVTSLSTPARQSSEHVADGFRAAMRKLAGTITIVSATDGKQRYALVATAVTSVSLEPPTLLVCVNKAASIHSSLVSGSTSV